MPIDISMYRQNPLRSMADYQGDYNKLDAQNQALQQGVIALQQAQPRFQAELALKNAQAQDTLAQVPLRAAQARSASTQADANEYKLKIDKMTNAIKDITSLSSVEDAQQSIKDHLNKGEIDFAKANGLINSLPKNPAEFPMWQRKMVLGIMDAKDRFAATTPKTLNVNLGATEGFFNIDPLTGARTPMGETPRTVSPDAQLAAESRVRAAGVSASVRQDNRAPVAVLDDNGNAVYVPPSDAVGRTPAKMGVELSPMDKQKREAAYPTATTAVKTFESTSSETEKDLEKLMNHPGLSSITGIAAGRMPGLTADGRAAQALYDKIQARGGFSELASLKASGGTLGQVSNAEGQFLRAAFAAIDRRQNASDVQKAIADAIEKVRGARQRIKDSYDLTYEYRSGNKQESPKAPSAPQPSVSNW